MPTQLDPASTTIIDDGDFRYPVSTAALQKWEAEYGKITPQNYQQFCDSVDHLMPRVLPGSEKMISECASLLEAGAAFYRP